MISLFHEGVCHGALKPHLNGKGLHGLAVNMYGGTAIFRSGQKRYSRVIPLLMRCKTNVHQWSAVKCQQWQNLIRHFTAIFGVEKSAFQSSFRAASQSQKQICISRKNVRKSLKAWNCFIINKRATSNEFLSQVPTPAIVQTSIKQIWVQNVLMKINIEKQKFHHS